MLIFFVFPALLVLAACASSASFTKIDHTLGQAHYAESADMLERSKKSLYSGRDGILYYLDKGMLSHYAGRYADSSRLLESGERAIEAAFTKSVTMEIGSYLLNDNTREYAGEDYEDIYINAFNALNYYHRGRLEDALVEIRRMSGKIRNLSTKYGEINSSLRQKALDEDLGRIPANPNTPGRFTDSALGRYLGMLFYRAWGRPDDARIDRDGLLAVLAHSPGSHRPPSSLAGELEIPPGMARLNVIAFSGLSPVKREQVMRIPLPGSRWVKIAIPELEFRRSDVSRIELAFDSGDTFNLELLEDIEATARETFKTRQNVVYLKTAIRAMIKGAGSSALTVAAKEVEDPETSALLELFSIIAQVFAETSENADLRISRYFPGKAFVGGINLKPGIYSFHVKFYNKNGRELASQSYKDMRITEGGLNLAEAACLR